MEEIIKAENLTKAYGTLLAVDHVSLWVKRGTAFGLLGANGAGKSTVIECILGVKQPDGGTVSVLSLDPRKDRRLFQQVGVQFQECGCQPEIKVSELCEETACLYKTPGDWRRLVEALCDEICILQKGRAVFYGTVAQAKEKSGCENFEDAYLKLSGEEME